MTIQRFKRKIYNLTHPVVGEIWMLHRVVEQRSEKPEQRELEVTPEWLAHQIDERRSLGWRFVSIDEARDIMKETHLFQPHSPFVCITFDDGYRDNYTIAYPLLKRLNVPFIVYVSTGFLDNQREMWWYPGQRLAMSTEELLTLDADPLCTIGAHTVSHPKLDTLTWEDQYKEVAESKHVLETQLGHEVKHFSFPHGAYNDYTLAICHMVGLHTTVRSWGGALRREEMPNPLPRLNINGK